MGRALKKAWIPLVLVVVLAISGLVVSRLHKMFASQDLNANAGAGIEIVQFNPKIMVYDVYGPPGPPPRSATSTRMPTCIDHHAPAVVDHVVDDVADGQRQSHGAGRHRPDWLPRHRERNRP